MQPEISIITPSLNQAAYIEQAIQSVQNQGGIKLQHIIMDGASTDGTVEILNRYEHLQWWSHEDAGQTAALNAGLRQVSGAVVGWLNADDYYLDGTLNFVRDWFAAHPDVDFLYGGVRILDEASGTFRDRQVRPFNLPDVVNGGNVIALPSVFFRSSLLERGFFFNECFNYAMDYEFWCRLAFHHVSMARTDRILSTFRRHGESKTVKSNKRFWPEERAVARRYGGSYFSSMLWQRLKNSLTSADPHLALLTIMLLAGDRSLQVRYFDAHAGSSTD